MSPEDPSPHPNETMLRQAYAQFAQGDLAGFLTHCTPDISFRLPGQTPLSGTHARDHFFSAVMGDVMRLSEGSFRQTVVDVVANDHRGVVFVHHALTRAGRPYEYGSAHAYRIVHGKLATLEEYPEDLDAFEAAWGRVG